MASRNYIVYFAFLLALGVNAVFWSQTRDLRAHWANVPPAPSESGAGFMALGDRQFAYRSSGIMLQNLGNLGGSSTPLKDYDFKALGGWFRLLDRLDPESDFMPFLAAYYFGAAPEGTDISPLVDYLEETGSRPGDRNWRWLAQAVFLAHYRMNDFNRALELADKLSRMWEPGRPGWMKQMQAFLMAERGDRQAAYDLMIRIITDGKDDLHPEEIHSMVIYLCTRLLDPAQAAVHPLCTNIR